MNRFKWPKERERLNEGNESRVKKTKEVHTWSKFNNGPVKMDIISLIFLPWIGGQRLRRALVLGWTVSGRTTEDRATECPQSSTFERARHLSVLECLLEILQIGWNTSATFTEWFDATGYEKAVQVVGLSAPVFSLGGWCPWTHPNKYLIARSAYAVA